MYGGQRNTAFKLTTTGKLSKTNPTHFQFHWIIISCRYLSNTKYNAGLVWQDSGLGCSKLGWGKPGSVLASRADDLRDSSRVPAPRTSAELKDKFLSHCSQISAGDHMQIIGDPIGAVEVKVLTSQTHTYKLCRVWYVTKDFCSWREYRR